MHHEPCTLLSDADGPRNLPRTHAVFAIHEQPHCGEPLIQTQRRVLKDRARLQRELTAWMMASALPAIMLLGELNVLAAAVWAFDSIRPASRYKIFAAVLWIGEILDGLLESLRVHVIKVLHNSGVVKYIIAKLIH